MRASDERRDSQREDGQSRGLQRKGGVVWVKRGIQQALDAGNINPAVIRVRMVAVDQQREYRKKSGAHDSRAPGWKGRDPLLVALRFGEYCEGRQRAAAPTHRGSGSPVQSPC